jgi:hypothetical protein
MRTYMEEKPLEWQQLAQEIFLHVSSYKEECPQLNITLDKLLVIISEYH